MGTEAPALCEALSKGAWASADLSCPLGKIWPGLLSSSVQVPGPATWELLARTPLKPGEAPPGKAALAIPVLLLVQPRFGAEQRFGQPCSEEPVLPRNTRDSAPEPRSQPGPGLRADGAEAEAPGTALRILAPLGSASGPGFFPGPGQVFLSTAQLAEDRDGDALRAQGAGCGHKSLCGPSFPVLPGCSGLLSPRSLGGPPRP